MRAITRRRVLSRTVLGAAGLAVLAACSSPAPAPAATTPPEKPATAPAAGASTPAPAAGAAGAPAAGGKSLRVAINATQQRAQQLTDFGKAFKDKSGVTVEWSPFQAPDWDQFFVKLLTEMAGGKATDLVSIATEGLQIFSGKDLALKIDDYAKSDKGAIQEYFSDVAPS